MKQNKIFRLMLTLVLALCAWTTASADYYTLTVGTATNVAATDGVLFKVNNTTVTSAAAGAEVTIVVTPKDGYLSSVENIKATASMGTGNMQARTRASLIKDITVTQAVDGQSQPIANTYIITMPAADVTVDVVCGEEITETGGAFTVSLASTSLTYTGSAIKPAVTVKKGDNPLTQNTDYTVTYSNNINAGTATATIIGKGQYKGTVLKEFTINAATITASAYSRSYTYDGYSHSIDVSVSKPSSGNTIEYSTDNSTWSSTKPSRYQVGSTTVYYKVTAPNYNDKTGSATVTITRATGSIAFDPTEVTKTWGDPNFTKTYSSKKGSGSITYSSDDENVATVTNSGVVTIKAAGTAHIKVNMAQSSGYTSASATYTLTVNPADLSEAVIALDQTSFDYDGTEKKPNVKFAILNETTVLKADKDYTVSYADNVNAGTEALAIISGIGNYTGTASQTFTITSVTTTDGNITVVDGGSETVLTINDMGNQQGKTVTPDLQVTTLNYYRSLNASDESVYTVCLPYAPKTDASLKYYTLTGCEGTTLKFDEITGAPQAYTPYLVSASKTTDIGTENLNQPITMSQTVDNSFSAGNYVMKGSLSGFTHDQSVGKYILQSGNRWGLVGSDTHAYIPPFRAYIEATVSGARMLDSSFYDEATGIYSLRTVDRDGTERYYDLNGRRIDDPKKTGIYIRNGRKEVLK